MSRPQKKRKVIRRLSCPVFGNLRTPVNMATTTTTTTTTICTATTTFTTTTAKTTTTTTASTAMDTTANTATTATAKTTMVATTTAMTNTTAPVKAGVSLSRVPPRLSLHPPILAACSCSSNSASSVPHPAAITPEEKGDLLVRCTPRTPGNIVGAEPQYAQLQRWVRNKNKMHNICLLTGPPGVGKSTCARVVASEEGLPVVEINTSENRSSALLRKIIGQTCSVRAKSGKRQLLLLEEIDGAYDGGKGSVVDIVLQNIKEHSQKPNFPVIVATCNDDRKSLLRKLTGRLCLRIQFSRLQPQHVRRLVRRSAQAVGLAEVPEEAMERIVELANGDARQVLYQLEWFALSPTSFGAKRGRGVDHALLSTKEIVSGLLLPDGVPRGQSKPPDPQDVENNVHGSLFASYVQHNVVANIHFSSGNACRVMEDLSSFLDDLRTAEEFFGGVFGVGGGGDDNTLNDVSRAVIVQASRHYGRKLLCSTRPETLIYSQPKLFTSPRADHHKANSYQSMLVKKNK